MEKHSKKQKEIKNLSLYPIALAEKEISGESRFILLCILSVCFWKTNNLSAVWVLLQEFHVEILCCRYYEGVHTFSVNGKKTASVR